MDTKIEMNMKREMQWSLEQLTAPDSLRDFAPNIALHISDIMELDPEAVQTLLKGNPDTLRFKLYAGIDASGREILQSSGRSITGKKRT